MEPANTHITFDVIQRENELKRAADLRRQITAHPVVSGRDVAHKTRLLTEARNTTNELSTVADAIVAVGLRAGELKGKKIDVAFAALAMAVMRVSPGYSAGLIDEVESIQAGRPPGVVPRIPLHWPLAFPEVFADTLDPGFDAIIGNPPFLGGKKISGALGNDYLAWLVRWDGHGIRGSADLAARFVLRAEKLLTTRGQLGYIATNTLVQGDTLEVGLTQAASRGLTIRRATPSHPWPSSSASLEIVDVWASRAPVSLSGARTLAGEAVPAIGADLEPVGRVVGRPSRLTENDGLAYIGTNPLGLGFTMTAEEAKALISRDARNADVLQPYVIGQDLNQRPGGSASRWIINFRDWSFDRANTYPEVLSRIRQAVKPQRDKLPDYKKRVRDAWWRYEHQAPALYRAIEGFDYAIGLARVSSSIAPVRIPVGPVYSEKVVVFATDSFGQLSILCSSAHTAWTVRYTSTLETRINYAPSDCFLTFPRPETSPLLDQLGSRLDADRKSLMLERAWGLTTLYNHVHDPAEIDPAVKGLRTLHTDIDQAVMDAYGWDLDLEIGHHFTKIGTRWTVSPRARFELLDLLLEENHRRAALQAAKGNV